MFETVEGFADPADVDALGGLGGRVADHRTKEAVFLEGGEIFRLEQINCDEAHFFPSSAKGIEVDLGPTPFASRLAERARRRGRGGGGFGGGVSGPGATQRGEGGGTGDGTKGGAAGDRR